MWVSEGCSARFSLAAAKPRRADHYVPGAGFKIADGEQGAVSVRVFTYVRYLNQEDLDPTFTDSFGNTRTIQRRQDFQLNKAQVNFYGWVLSERLRYLAYVWSANTSQGQSGQVVVAGNVSYEFNQHFRLGGGIGALPGVRSTEGNFPYWLSVDNRQIADEFFRPSYTTGIWAEGSIVDGVAYHVMLGNNISQFGIDAGQLDNKLSTWSGALTWEPMGDYGRPFGDFEGHDSLVTRFGVHLTTSDETRQSQPDTDAFDNVQIRISDGNVIFEPNLFAPDTQVDEATYNMTSVDAGFKLHGFSLEGEYYWRRGRRFHDPGRRCAAVRRDRGRRLPGPGFGDGPAEDPPGLRRRVERVRRVRRPLGLPGRHQLVPVEEPGCTLQPRVHRAPPLAGRSDQSSLYGWRKRARLLHQLHDLALIRYCARAKRASEP